MAKKTQERGVSAIEQSEIAHTHHGYLQGETHSGKGL
jgi:hypothetical protein